MGGSRRSVLGARSWRLPPWAPALASPLGPANLRPPAPRHEAGWGLAPLPPLPEPLVTPRPDVASLCLAPLPGAPSPPSAHPCPSPSPSFLLISLRHSLLFLFSRTYLPRLSLPRPFPPALFSLPRHLGSLPWWEAAGGPLTLGVHELPRGAGYCSLAQAEATTAQSGSV